MEGCTALRKLWLNENHLTVGPEPLQGHTAWEKLCLGNNELPGVSSISSPCEDAMCYWCR